MVFEDKMVILEIFTFWREIVFHDTLNNNNNNLFQSILLRLNA